MNIRNNFPIFDTINTGSVNTESVSTDFVSAESATSARLPLVYLDNAATTHKPLSVIQALTHFYAHEYGSVHRGLYDLAEQATSQYEQVRQQCASFINAHSAHEIVFTSGSTHSINLIAQSWVKNNLHPGDEIVLSALEHHSNIVPWQLLAQQEGFRLVWLPVSDDGTLARECVDYITNKTKLVVLTHSSQVMGPLNHEALSALRDRAQLVGARILLDCAQTVAHQKIDVQALGIDFAVFSGHKMFGPTGIGIAYIRAALHGQLVPYQTGGGMIFSVDMDRVSYRPMPHLLEAGTPPIAQVIGLGAAITFIQEKIYFSVVQAHEQMLMERLLMGLQNIPGVKVWGNVSQLVQGHVVLFTHKAIHAHDIAAYLATKNICVRAGNHCAQLLHKRLGITSSVRVSIAAYNEPIDIDRLIHFLKECVENQLFM